MTELAASTRSELDETQAVRWGRIGFVSLLLVAIAGGAFLVLRPAEPPKPELLTVSLGDAVSRTEAAGRIVPREEVFVRSLVAGQLVELRVRPGDYVKKGTHLATVSIVADPVSLSEARAQVRVAEARLSAAQRELARLRPLQAGIAVSSQETAKAEDEERLARTELEGLRERVQLIARGVASAAGGRSTRILATIAGTVLATPVAVGDFVTDMNAYREGSTIAVLADMSHLLFKGQIEEAHVGKLRLGMPADVRVGALAGLVSKGTLSWVAPRATVESAGAGSVPASPSASNAVVPLTASTTGITRFELWIELDAPPAGMRAGYTASAELTVERRERVPLVEERALRFERGKVFARVQREAGRLEERELHVGVSDGVKIEVVSGLAVGDRVAANEPPRAQNL